MLSSPDLSLNDESGNQKQNEATWISADDSKRWNIRLKVWVGHSIRQCGGKCIKLFWEWGHIDCRGFGDICERSAGGALSIAGDGNGYIITLENPDELGEFLPTDETKEILEYPFPDRSFFITNPRNKEEQWLNIPEQQLIKYNFKDEPVVIYNVWFSEKPKFEKN